MGQISAARTAAIALTSVLAGLLGVGVAGSPSVADDRVPASPAEVIRLEGDSTRPVAEGSGIYTAYAVPTSAAGLDKIVTAPNGDMWFEMEDANKIGRITPAGVITEFGLGETTTGEGKVQDLTVAPDGSIWVVYDTGWRALHVQPDLLSATSYSLGSYPYGDDVEMGPDGVPWITMSYDENGLARILPGVGALWAENAPPCDGLLARAHDGGMWCEGGLNQLILSNADATGGMTYPLPSRATDLRSLAAGPVGSLWFSRYSATWLTAPARGDVGWIDQATGQTTIFDTGSRTGPTGLIQGPDGAMWFANHGVGKGIGHLDANGRGALTKVGDYEGDHLAFDHQGNLWFTDSDNNVIVRVHPSDLQTTNVEVGEGSVFAPPVNEPEPPPVPQPPVAPPPVTTPPVTPPPVTPPPGAQPPGTPTAPAGTVGKVRAGKKPFTVRRNKVRLSVTCPKSTRGSCTGTAVLRHQKKAQRLSGATRYQVRSGRTKALVLTLNKAGRKAVSRKPVQVRATLVTRDGAAVRDRRIRLHR